MRRLLDFFTRLAWRRLVGYRSALLLALTLLVGCGGIEPVETHTSGVNFVAERVGEIDGCNVWRFAGGNAYAVICPDGRTQTTMSHTVYCGKGCVRTVRVPVIVATKLGGQR